ncbi:hypothetical protein [Gordonibacter pamelaeae]|uniref:hypothetical protein n=1 Tax=Gordonibacter pamelaeae TaxID=471189 RepID=UPI003A912D22
MGAEKDSLRMLLACAPHAECRAVAIAFGVEDAGCEGASAEECEDCLERLAEAVSSRLTPSGVEWPRFEDGEPARFGDEVECALGSMEVSRIALGRGGFELSGADGAFVRRERGEAVRRPRRYAPGADGDPVRPGDRVWLVPGKRRFCEDSGEDYSLLGIEPRQALDVASVCEYGAVMEQMTAWCPADWLTHEEPDAQERIVRCADCRHARRLATCGLVCALHGDAGWFATDADGFCHRGERR